MYETNTIDITEAKVFPHINRQLKIVLNRLVKKRLDDILGDYRWTNWSAKRGLRNLTRNQKRHIISFSSNRVYVTKKNM